MHRHVGSWQSHGRQYILLLSLIAAASALAAAYFYIQLHRLRRADFIRDYAWPLGLLDKLQAKHKGVRRKERAYGDTLPNPRIAVSARASSAAGRARPPPRLRRERSRRPEADRSFRPPAARQERRRRDVEIR